MKAVRIVSLFLGVLLMAPYCLAQQEFDFSITRDALDKLANEGVAARFKVEVTARTKKVHLISADCEIHMAAKLQGLTLGDPGGIVLEPPNVCKIRPAGTPATSEKNLREVVWPREFDNKVMHKTCEVSGFPRIFTEHAEGGQDAANPNHVFEIHPALRFDCGDASLDFHSFLKFFPKMRAIKPATAASCIEKRTLQVRFADGEYQFLERGGQCGNFAIVEVGNVNSQWVRSIPGGHSTIARVSADGESRATLKLYTLAGTQSDQWLANFVDHPQGNPRKLIHGLFTYDYFAILKVLKPAGGDWVEPQDWTDIPFPLAFVVFGDADRAPWDEE